MDYITAICLFIVAAIASWHLGRCIHEVYLAYKAYKYAKEHPETNKPIEAAGAPVIKQCPPHKWEYVGDVVTCKICGYRIAK